MSLAYDILIPEVTVPASDLLAWSELGRTYLEISLYHV